MDLKLDGKPKNARSEFLRGCFENVDIILGTEKIAQGFLDV